MFLLYRVTARGGWRRRARVMWGYLSDYGWAGTGAGAVYIVCVVVGLWGCHGLGLLGAHLAVLWSVCGVVTGWGCWVRILLYCGRSVGLFMSSITLTSVGLCFSAAHPLSPALCRLSLSRLWGCVSPPRTHYPQPSVVYHSHVCGAVNKPPQPQSLICTVFEV